MENPAPNLNLWLITPKNNWEARPCSAHVCVCIGTELDTVTRVLVQGKDAAAAERRDGHGKRMTRK